jgi:hypothetical protein
VLRVAAAAGHFDGMTIAQAEDAALEVLAGRYAVLVQFQAIPAMQYRNDGRVDFRAFTVRVTDVPGPPGSAVAFHNLPKEGEANGNQT